MSKVHIATIEMLYDDDQQCITVKMTGRDRAPVRMVADNLCQLVMHMHDIIEKKPDAMMGQFSKEVSNG